MIFEPQGIVIVIVIIVMIVMIVMIVIIVIVIVSANLARMLALFAYAEIDTFWSLNWRTSSKLPLKSAY